MGLTSVAPGPAEDDACGAAAVGADGGAEATRDEPAGGRTRSN